MSTKYEYDNSGLSTSYLLLAIMLPLTSILTLKKITNKSHPKTFNCDCKKCIEKNSFKKSSLLSVLTLPLLWILISFLLKNILTIKTEIKEGKFNPFKVLEVEEGATPKQVKMAFRKLIKLNNPERAEEKDKERVVQKAVELSKAYNILRDAESLEKFKASEVENRSSEGVAIPTWIMKKGYFVLVIYGIILGIFLPKWALKKWRESIEMNVIGVYFSTMEELYKSMNSSILGKDDYSTVRNLIGIMVNTKEFKDKKFKSKNIESLKNVIEVDFAVPLKSTKDVGYFVLMDHLFRTGRAEKEDLKYVQEKSIKIINGMRKIAIAKSIDKLLGPLYVLERMIVQAVFDPEYYMLQLPNVTFESLLMNVKGKTQHVSEFLNSNLSEEDSKRSIKIYNDFPKIQISSLKAFVKETGVVDSESEEKPLLDEKIVKDEKIAEIGKKDKFYELEKGSLVTIEIELKREAKENEPTYDVSMGSEGIGYVLGEGEETDISLLNGVGCFVNTPVHCPYFYHSKNLDWNVYASLNGNLIRNVPGFSDFKGSKKVFFEFEGSSKPSEANLKVYVVSGCYFGIDVADQITLKYV